MVRSIRPFGQPVWQRVEAGDDLVWLRRLNRGACAPVVVAGEEDDEDELPEDSEGQPEIDEDEEDFDDDFDDDFDEDFEADLDEEDDFEKDFAREIDGEESSDFEGGGGGDDDDGDGPAEDDEDGF